MFANKTYNQETCCWKTFTSPANVDNQALRTSIVVVQWYGCPNGLLLVSLYVNIGVKVQALRVCKMLLTERKTRKVS